MISSQRILVTGADGQVGRALQALMPDAHCRPRSALDVTDSEAVEDATKDMEVVIHLAALTNVDACERQSEQAMAINGRGTQNVVAAARKYGARVIYMSTDYVFKGDDAHYSELDPVGPVNVYGRSKLAGEQHLDPREGDLTVRTSWVFGDGRNFVRKVLSVAGKRKPLTVVDDQIGRPTSAGDLARAVKHLVDKPGDGLLHVAGDGSPASWADVAELALGCAGLPATVTRVSSETFSSMNPGPVAPRPPNSTLSLKKARDLGVPLGDWRSSLRRYVEGLV